MKCNTKSVLFAGVGLLAALAIADAALPEVHSLVLGAVLACPFILLLLLCPLSMMFMMKGMSPDRDRTQPVSISTGKVIEPTDGSSTRVS